MRLLIIRHAIAVARGTPGIPDEERPLTPEGEKKFRRAARGLARVSSRPKVLLTSPWRRALRTAEIAAEAWGRIRPKKTEALAGGTFETLCAELAAYGGNETVALVGHEPGLSAVLARLLGTLEDDRLTFRKGGAALVEVPGRPEEGGRLLWYLPPRLLRELGR
jgi:phosphohistidine phosphatase